MSQGSNKKNFISYINDITISGTMNKGKKYYILIKNLIQTKKIK
jgi:hypothetical protein